MLSIVEISSKHHTIFESVRKFLNNKELISLIRSHHKNFHFNDADYLAEMKPTEYAKCMNCKLNGRNSLNRHVEIVGRLINSRVLLN
jgi:hypothetical protein